MIDNSGPIYDLETQDQINSTLLNTINLPRKMNTL